MPFKYSYILRSKNQKKVTSVQSPQISFFLFFLVLTFTFLLKPSLFQSSFFPQAFSKKKHAKTRPLSKEIKKRIQKSKLPKQRLSLIITSHKKGSSQSIYKWNDSLLLNPASLTKIITAGAALKFFPLDHRFKTQLFISHQEDTTSHTKKNQVNLSQNSLKKKHPSKIANKTEHKTQHKTINGHLYMKGGGDPHFTSESLWNLVNHFLRSDFKIIKGDIIVDDSLFEKKRKKERHAQTQKSYDAPIGALSFNWNSVNIFIRPSKKIHQPVRVYTDPENDYIHLTNRAITVHQKSKTRLNLTRSRNHHVPGDTISITGALGQNHKEKTYYLNITQPALWTGYNLKSFLKQRNIQVLGKVKRGLTPSHAKLVAEIKSEPIQTIISSMMKFSSNYIAEMLAQNLSLLGKKKPAQMKEGLNLIKTFLKELSISEKNFVLESASGLSTKNRLRVKDIHKVLESLRKNFRIFPDFLSTLPINAIDGTLKDRMDKNPSTKAWIRAKTGTLNHVSGLAGFASKKNGRLFTFAFLFNAPQQTSRTQQNLISRAEKLFDEISELLVLHPYP